MKLLLDQGLPRTTAEILSAGGLPCVHVGEIGLAQAEDEQVLRRAVHDASVVVTLDADFHAMVVRSGLRGPSVIRIRIEGLKAEPLASLLRNVILACHEDLVQGAVVTVDERQIRVRRLPVRQ